MSWSECTNIELIKKVAIMSNFMSQILFLLNRPVKVKLGSKFHQDLTTGNKSGFQHILYTYISTYVFFYDFPLDTMVKLI